MSIFSWLYGSKKKDDPIKKLLLEDVKHEKKRDLIGSPDFIEEDKKEDTCCNKPEECTKEVEEASKPVAYQYNDKLESLTVDSEHLQSVRKYFDSEIRNVPRWVICALYQTIQSYHHRGISLETISGYLQYFTGHRCNSRILKRKMESIRIEGGVNNPFGYREVLEKYRNRLKLTNSTFIEYSSRPGSGVLLSELRSVLNARLSQCEKFYSDRFIYKICFRGGFAKEFTPKDLKATYPIKKIERLRSAINDLYPDYSCGYAEVKDALIQIKNELKSGDKEQLAPEYYKVYQDRESAQAELYMKELREESKLLPDS